MYDLKMLGTFLGRQKKHSLKIFNGLTVVYGCPTNEASPSYHCLKSDTYVMTFI